jgi:SIT4-associating protein SAP185/190
LTSEIWVIPETILQNKDTLLRPFWDAVIPPVPTGADEEAANTPEALYEVSEAYRARVEFGSEADDEQDRKREIIRGLWVKVNLNLMTKRTHEVKRGRAQC